MREKIFVYGTLMQGCRAHCMLADVKFLGQAFLLGYAMYQVASYPGIVPEPGEAVYGEVYEVDGAALGCIDRYEGALFSRKKVTTYTFYGDVVETHVYVWQMGVGGRKKVPMSEQPWEERVLAECNVR
ncbi:MAG: gamma-glutamylcyclotransferase family protein [Bacillota bacterium]